MHQHRVSAANCMCALIICNAHRGPVLNIYRGSSTIIRHHCGTAQHSLLFCVNRSVNNQPTHFSTLYYDVLQCVYAAESTYAKHQQPNKDYIYSHCRTEIVQLRSTTVALYGGKNLVQQYFP
jgi:hypothetical protein